RVVGGRRQQHRDGVVLAHARARERARALEAPRRHHRRAAEVDLLAPEEGDAGRVVEDGRGVGGLGGEGPREAHALAAVLEEGEAGRPHGGGGERYQEDEEDAPSGAAGHGIKTSAQEAGRKTRVSRPPPGRGAKRTKPPRSRMCRTASPKGPGSLPAAMRCWSSGPSAPSCARASMRKSRFTS